MASPSTTSEPRDCRPGHLEGLDHLLQAGDLGIDDVVRQDHGKRLIANELLRHQHGVAETLGLRLANVADPRNS